MGEVCRSGEGMWDIAGNGTVGQHVRCVLVHHSECLSLQATFTFRVLISLSSVNVECDPASQFMCADQVKCVDIQFCCQAIQLSRLCRGLREETRQHYR